MSRNTYLKELYREIESKRIILIDDPNAGLKYHNVNMDALDLDSRLTRKEELEAIAHSARIEHPLAHIDNLNLPRPERRRYKRELSEITSRLRAAWVAALPIFPFNGEVTPEHIIEIARKIEPRKNAGGYRREIVKIGSDYTLPPEQIQREMNLSLYENRRISSPLEQAFHLHLHIARIHPFLDGNGRTSRLIQNLLLNNFGYPSVLIREGERQLYFDVLNDAKKAYIDRKSEGHLSREEDLFYEFLGSKVNMALDRILYKS